MNRGRLTMDKPEKGKTPGWGIPPTLCLTSRNSASFPQWRFEKKPLSFLVGEGQSSHLKILQSILFCLTQPALKWNYLGKPHQLEFYESLTSLEEGKHLTPACSELPYREERDPIPFSSRLWCERKETSHSSPLETSCTIWGDEKKKRKERKNWEALVKSIWTMDYGDTGSRKDRDQISGLRSPFPSTDSWPLHYQRFISHPSF